MLSAVQMTDTMSRRPYPNMNVSASQTHKDVTDDRYRDLRRPRKVRFFVNGDRYFKGKKLYITPHRYFNFNDLLNDLTGKLPSNLSLPYGVRQIFTPVSGRRVTEIEDLSDGENYVCAGFEGFKTIKYGKAELEPWSVEQTRRIQNEILSDHRSTKYGLRKTRPHNHEFGETESNFGATQGAYGRTRGMYGSNAFHPGRFFHGTQPHRRWAGTFGHANKNTYLPNADNIPLKPKVVTIVRNGHKPRNNVKILLNRRSVQSFEQLMADISEAFGPKYKNNKVKKLFSIRGREVQGISDFFRDDDVFIGVGGESLTETDIVDIVEELYPDSSMAKSILRELERNKRKRHNLAKQTQADHDADKRDSGFGEGSDGSNREQDGEYVIYKGRPQEKGKRRNDYPKEYELAGKLEQEKDKAVHDERERTKKRQQKMMETERRALDEERRKRGLVPNKPEDPFKRIKEQKEKEKEEARKKKEEERLKKLEEEEKEKQKKEQEARERAIQAARDRQAAAEKAERVKAEKEKAEREKMEKEKAEKEDKEKPDKDSKEAANKDKTPRDQKADAVTKEKSPRDPKATKEKTDPALKDKEKAEKKRKSKSKIVRKSKLERQVSGDEHITNKYDLGRTLGDGNFAIVRQSKLKAGSGEYAMKVIDKPKLRGKEHMVENEIEIMKDCHHHNIVKLYEEYETSDKIYLVMELVKGGDLFDAITQSVKFGEVDSARMVKDLCNALFYLHSRSIVHRDLKPENLLVHRNKDGSISLKLADFGLAMEVKEPIFTVCGTPTYVAPEILSEIGYGLEVDMWAVGVITYILLCGFPPFRSPDRNQTELFEFIKAGEYEFLSPYWDNISPYAKDLIEHLLVVDKKKRYTAIETLSHPWILLNGDMSRPPESSKLDEMRKNTRKELELQAKQSYDSYQKLKEKRKLEQQAAS
ncbi:serine/threonine-protein kinase DCLK2-like isoform X1 [Crassostrea angulata]|uniref:serine/threonine-protein kinase DCLK2-like isoform X1 n=1 Tax=Magallana angulata TaxID=2784310 RepID=UPI0022B21890|nr:serine/threonine-protein kinase DCLK2-like isoform X1 [Crassostrea angulata]XP_052694393.1 serine/threonine-protein kinase DCLK2-like isoform X1 [Crassostrea angulata]